jgi:hypothetical protein
VSERNTEENLSLKGVPPSLKEPLQGDLRGCLRVLPLLFYDIYSAFRKQNIAKRIVGTVRDYKSVHQLGRPAQTLRTWLCGLIGHYDSIAWQYKRNGMEQIPPFNPLQLTQSPKCSETRRFCFFRRSPRLRFLGSPSYPL